MKEVAIIVESPRGSDHKYDHEPATGRFKLKKILPAGLVFPFDFGFIPDTKGEDGDPLDIIVVSEVSSFPGCEIDCRLIGALKAEQTERNGDTMRNDRLIGVPIVSHLYSEVNELSQLPAAIIDQVEAFFRNYNEQAGKKFKVTGRLDAGQSAALIK